jgi:hypothetical protein
LLALQVKIAYLLQQVPRLQPFAMQLVNPLSSIGAKAIFASVLLLPNVYQVFAILFQSVHL